MGHNTKLFEQSFTHIGVLIFNKLSGEIKNIEPIKTKLCGLSSRANYTDRTLSP
jgi:hypothetical protein